jgi:hypothetical protein
MALLEREAPLRLAAEAVEQARLGHGGTLLVSGEAGIGKSTLIGRLLADLSRGPLVLQGRCEDLSSPRPLGPLHDMDLARRLPLPVREAMNDSGSADALFSSVLDVVGGTTGGTVIVFEDVHWADQATLDLVKYLSRRIGALPVLLVLTFRDDGLGPNHPLRRALNDLPLWSVRRLALQPLSSAAVAALAALAGRPDTGLHRVPELVEAGVLSLDLEQLRLHVREPAAEEETLDLVARAVERECLGRPARAEHFLRAENRGEHVHPAAVPHAGADDAAGTDDAPHLRHAGRRVVHERQHELRQRCVERLVGPREILGGSRPHVGARELSLERRDEGRRRVRRCDVGAATEQLRRERTRSCADVDDLLSCLHACKVREQRREPLGVAAHEVVVGGVRDLEHHLEYSRSGERTHRGRPWRRRDRESRRAMKAHRWPRRARGRAAPSGGRRPGAALCEARPPGGTRPRARAANRPSDAACRRG